MTSSLSPRRRLLPLLFAATTLPATFVGSFSGEQESTRPAPAVAAPGSEITPARIDDLVEALLREKGGRPNRLVDDETFCRRAYLTIVGRIPSVDELQAFLRTSGSRRRDRLVDELLDSEGRVAHEFNWWADLLRVKSRLANQVSGEPYADFVRRAVRENVPYDRFVRELLTAEGPAHARGGGPVGYYLRDRGMPEDNMANTARVFLGTRLECAQCHDHPFDRWKQKEFFELCAFTGGLRERFDPRRAEEAGIDVAWLDERGFRGMQEEVRERFGRDGQRALNRFVRPFVAGISGSGKGVSRLPRDYQYDDAAPMQIVEADTPFGNDVALEIEHPRRRFRNRRERARAMRGRNYTSMYRDVDSRVAFADWVTSPDNPRFTRVIANRMWKRIFGLGVIEPVDDLKDQTVPSNPELMAALEQLMRDVGYDLREFQRVLLKTQLFAREAHAEEVDPEEGFYFDGPLLRRMSAEQLWDSLITLVREDVDRTMAVAEQRAEEAYRRFESVASMTRSQLLDEIGFEVLRYTDPDRYRRERAQRARERRERATRAMKADGSRADGGGEIRDELRRLQRELRTARRRRDRDRVEEIAVQIKELREQGRRRVGRRDLVRAAALPSPAPPGHFLQQFGQSDREAIENAHADASVPQVLTLINGFVEERLLRDGSSLLRRRMAAADSDRDRIGTAYLAILGRTPSTSELRMWSRDVAEFGEQAWLDMVWTLVNTQEFRFVR